MSNTGGMKGRAEAGVRAENNAQASALAREMLRSPSAYVLVCRVDPDTPSI